MAATNQQVPTLRFTRFTEDWKEKILVNVCEKIQDGTHFSPNISENGEYKYITSKNIRNGSLTLENVDLISKTEHDAIYKRCDVRYGDVLITKDGASTGNVCLNTLEEEISLLSSVAFIRANSQVSKNSFIYQYICSPYGQRKIISAIAGQAITRITLTKIKNFKFSFPSLTEQQKIATFLSSIDTRIEQLNKKKALWEQYKKGMMQTLFSQEIRFKDERGKNYPDWEEKRLGEIFTIRYGKDHKNLHDGDIPVMGTGGVIRYVDSILYNQPSVLIGRKGTIDEPRYIEQPFWSVDTLFYTEIEPFYIPFFIFLVVLNINWKRYNEATGVPSLNANTIINIKVDIPCEEEQLKIANILSAIDKKIELVTGQLKHAQTFKKGLLQQMFI